MARIGVLFRPLNFNSNRPGVQIIHSKQPQTLFPYDLQLVVDRQNTAAQLQLRYNPATFKYETARSLLLNFTSYIKYVFTSGQYIKSAQLACPTEVQLLLRNFVHGPPNSTILKNPKLNVLDIFFTTVKKYPNYIAIELGNQTQTFTGLAHNVQGLACYLQQVPVKPGDKVAVIVDNHSNTIICMLAIWSIGAIYVPVNSTLPFSRQKYMVETAQCSHIVNASVADAEWPTAVSMANLTFDNSQPICYSSVHPIQPDDLAYIIFTSGTTGLPKGVMVQHNSLANIICNDSFKDIWKPAQRVLSVNPPGFDAYLFTVLSFILNGSTMVFYEDTFLTVLPTVQCAYLTVSIISSIEPHYYPQLRTLMCGAE
ncbi:hypothetical protein BJ085DRAFT_17527, partial [Dimargaris cristalligena]